MNTVDIQHEKTALRRDIRVHRAKLNTAWVDETSRVIEERLLELPEWRNASIAACYMALPREVQTDRLFENCRKRDMRVCVPCYDETINACRWAWHGERDATKMGRWVIPELPVVDWVCDCRPDIIIAPALGIDRRGRRLGQGGGHYDRLLAEPGGTVVCPVFDFQIVDRIPSEAHDADVDIAVTESTTMDFR